jgi:hypothetical protein
MGFTSSVKMPTFFLGYGRKWTRRDANIRWNQKCAAERDRVLRHLTKYAEYEITICKTWNAIQWSNLWIVDDIAK